MIDYGPGLGVPMYEHMHIGSTGTRFAFKTDFELEVGRNPSVPTS